MKSFNEYISENYTVTSSKSDDARGMIKFHKRPSDHDQWKCNKCGEWNYSSRKECSGCGRQHGGERVETRNGSLLLRSMIKSLEDAIHELSLGKDMLYNSGFKSFLEILKQQKAILESKLISLEKFK